MQKDASLKGDTIKSENIREAHISLEDKLRNILEKANDCIIFLDKAGRIIDVNRKTLDVFGYSKGEVLGKHFTDLKVLSIKDMPKVMGKFSKILGGKEATLELSIKNKQGRQMLLECSGSIIRTDGKFDGIMIIMRDVKERDQMQ
ncbi:PAS domain S-box protein, partial [Candidatus Bathyarchaeota archaeon]|nr:PAS domain S-box protein [Candidatus Bathyarchaeota archaeon]